MADMQQHDTWADWVHNRFSGRFSRNTQVGLSGIILEGSQATSVIYNTWTQYPTTSVPLYRDVTFNIGCESSKIFYTCQWQATRRTTEPNQNHE